jgi:hypothetical protein
MTVTRSMRSRGARTLATLVVATLLMLASAQKPIDGARARAGGDPLSVSDFAAYQPIARYLSNASWLLVTGQDPRLLDASGSAPAVQNGFPSPVLSRSPSPFFSRNMLVTHDVGPIGVTSEPRIVADPLDPEHLVLAVVDYNLPSIAVYVTLDGGEIWDGPRQVRFFAQDVLAGGAPDLAFDRHGNLFLVSTSIGLDDVQIGSTLMSVATPNLVVSKSEDGGFSWSDATFITGSSVEVTSFPDVDGIEQTGVTFQYLDLPSIAIGPDPNEPERDLVYVAYTDFDLHSSTFAPHELPLLTAIGSESTIRLVRSNDGGQSWSDPIGISPTMTQTHFSFDGMTTASVDIAPNMPSAAPGSGEAPSSSNRQSGSATAGSEDLVEDVVQGADVAVMPDGTLAVAFLDTTFDGAHRGLAMVIAALSSDGGTSFAEPVQAGIFREIDQTPRTANFRFWSASFPQLATGEGDEIYLAVTAKPDDRPTDDGDVVLLRSMDLGQTWEPPLRLNIDDSDHLQFFPAISVDPDGIVHAIWGDMRNDPHEVRYDVFYSESSDRGSSWRVQGELNSESSDVRATDFASNSLVGIAGGRFLGDHFTLAANASDVYLAWVDTRLGELEAPNQQIGFARGQPLMSPSLHVRPTTGVAGSDVMVEGAGFQPVAPVTIGVGGAMLTTVISDEKGAVETSFTLPIDVAGSHEIRATDVTGNLATVDFAVTTDLDATAANSGSSEISATSSVESDATPSPPTP